MPQAMWSRAAQMLHLRLVIAWASGLCLSRGTGGKARARQEV